MVFSMFIINIIGFVFLLGLVILIHELGHYIMAKRAGILCHEFALGMGPILYSRKKGETLFSIRAIPIGGFVSMAGEEISDSLVSVGDEVRVLMDEKNPKKVTHIILNPEDPRYQDAELIEVERIDLKGKDGEGLYLNDYQVARDAFYVMKDKELQIAPYDRSFESKTLFERFSTIFAGPFMNFILALVIFFVIALLIGQPVMSSSELGAVSENAAADRAGLATGDVIVSIDGEPIDDWTDIQDVMDDRAGQGRVDIVVLRDETELTFSAVPTLQFFSAGFSSDPAEESKVAIGSVGAGGPADNAVEVDRRTQSGIMPNDVVLAIGYNKDSLLAVTTWEDVVGFMRDNTSGADMYLQIERDVFDEDGETVIDTRVLTYEVGPFSHRFLEGQGVRPIQNVLGIGPVFEFDFLASFPAALGQFGTTSTMIFSTLRALFAESRVGVGDLAGPIGIYTLTSTFISQGMIPFLTWIGILSVNLGIINLMPIPALDGGRLLFLGYEAVVKKPVNKRFENVIHLIMFILLITLFFFIAFNDVLRILGS